MSPFEFSDEAYFDRRNHRDTDKWWSSSSEHGMVSCAHYRATEAGVQVLEAGGNAIDAAIATSLALAVVEPAGSGIGGMAMMTILLSGRRPFVLAGPCRAPLSATPTAVALSARYAGYRAVATPTYIAVLEAALERYGTASLERVLAPAIRLAHEGFRRTSLYTRLLTDYRRFLAKRSAAPIFLDPKGVVPKPGEIFRQPILARTLERLARNGLRDFYEGEIAAEIAADMQLNDGFVSAQDLAAIHPPAETEPVRATFLGGEIYCPGPPAGGQTLAQMLHLLEELGTGPFELDAPAGIERLAVAIHRARVDRKHTRALRVGFDVASPEYARFVARGLREELGEGETSHLSVIDRAGNAVALTQSIERSFGAKVVTPSLGFLHNGYMKAFKIQRKDHPHYLRPGASARSNAAPTIAIRDGSAIAALGSTGSERMISGIVGVLARLRYQTPFASVHAPRLHVTPTREVLIEADRVPSICLDRLRDRGYTLRLLDPYSFKFGGLHLVVRQGGLTIGVADPRRDGAAAGPR